MSLPWSTRGTALALLALALLWGANSVSSSLDGSPEIGTAFIQEDQPNPAYGAGSPLVDGGHLCVSDKDDDAAFGDGEPRYLTKQPCDASNTVQPGDFRLTSFTDQPVGELVQPGDDDEGEPLSAPEVFQRLAYLDESDDGALDNGEHIYLVPAHGQLGTGAQVDSLRLTTFENQGAGRYVDQSDTDAASDARLVPITGTIHLTGSPETPNVYLRLTDTQEASVQSGDLRLSSTDNDAGTWIEPNKPILAIGQLLVALPVVAATAWITFTPNHADRTLRERYNLDLADSNTLIGVLIHFVFLLLVFGSTLLVTAEGLSQLANTGQHPAQAVSLSGESIVISLVLNLVLFLIAAVTWILLVDDTEETIPETLGLQLDELPKGILAGALVTVAVFIVLALLGFLIQQTGYAPENPQADAIANALTPATAIAVALLAGLGEEIYFRGFLLPRTGNLAQATLFGLLHATYLTPFQVLLPFALGLAFGWIRTKTSLWAPIVAHTAFNGIMLLSAIYADELAIALTAIL